MTAAAAERDVPAINPIRYILQPLFGWTWIIVFTVVMSALAIVTLGKLSYWITPAGLRLWGRGMLWIQGVKLDVEGAEHFAYPAARVATFNHTSSLDAMIIPAICPPGSTVAIKREVIYVPFIGVCCWLIGFLMIDRGRSQKAKRVLARAAERMKREELTVFIAPEGTRSPDGELHEFKKGAFYLAAASGAVITPVVICDSVRVHPRNCVISRQGTIKVRILESIDTAGLTPAEVPAFAKRLHALYLRELDDLRGDTEVSRAA